MTTTLEQYMEGSGAPSFEAKPRYFADGDFVSYFLEDGMYYAQRIDKHVTAYFSEDTGRMVGCKIKSVSALLRELGTFTVQIVDHASEIHLWMLFLTAATITGRSNHERYAELSKTVGNVAIRTADLPRVAIAA